MNTKLACAALLLIVMPALIGYATGMANEHGAAYAFVSWGIFVLFFSVGSLVKYWL